MRKFHSSFVSIIFSLEYYGTSWMTKYYPSPNNQKLS